MDNTLEADKMITESFELYSGTIYKYILYQVRNREVALDLTQEVFIDAHIKHELFRLVTNKKAWLLKDASYQVLRYLSRDRKKEDALVPLDDSGIESIIVSDYYKDGLEKYKEMLNENEYKILEYKYLFGFQNKEIAKICKISKNACNLKLKRIKEKIKNSIPNSY